MLFWEIMLQCRLEKNLSLPERECRGINCVEDKYWGGGRFFLGLMDGFMEVIDRIMNFDKIFFTF